MLPIKTRHGPETHREGVRILSARRTQGATAWMKQANQEDVSDLRHSRRREMVVARRMFPSPSGRRLPPT